MAFAGCPRRPPVQCLALAGATAVTGIVAAAWLWARARASGTFTALALRD